MHCVNSFNKVKDHISCISSIERYRKFKDAACLYIWQTNKHPTIHQQSNAIKEIVANSK